jgi:hypothetical protein
MRQINIAFKMVIYMHETIILMLKHNSTKMCSNEICSKVHTGKHFSHTFVIQNGLRQGDAYRDLAGNPEANILLVRTRRR